MKQKLLLIAGLMATTAIGAQTSPWAGNELPVEGGTFYFYNVATGKWLQNNNRVAEDWTTRAQVDAYGFDVDIVAEEGGYRLDPKFGHNHSINGWDDFGYLDTGRDVTYWTLQPIEGSQNGYRIFTGNQDHFLNTNDDGLLDDFGFNEEWQLITREERLADMKTATKANPKDATWLIGAYDFANQDDRRADFHWTSVNLESEGSGDGATAYGGDGICHANMAFECWKRRQFVFSKTLTGMPNGTYEFSLQGFYRDGREVEIGNKYLAGEEVIRAEYFANDASAPLMSICQSGVYEENLDAYAVAQGGVYIPGNSIGGNALDRASNCFFLGGYWNAPIRVVVSDGTLTIGVRKTEGVFDDWTVFDTFHLTYLGDEIDLSEVLANLQTAIDDAETYDGLPVALLTKALSDAKALLTSTDATAIANAAMALRNAKAAAIDYTNVMAAVETFDGVSTDFFTAALEAARTAAESETDLDAFNRIVADLNNALNDVRSAQDPLQFLKQTLPLASRDGVDADIIASAQAVTEHAESLGAINDALNQLRIARKIRKADKQPDVYQGNEPADGDFYIYNVGLERFLCGGGDWGAHAYVGFPGVEVTLISGTEFPAEGEAFSGYKIDTHLNNGGESEYLNYGGYMDTPTQSLWAFLPVEGKAGVYNIARANGEVNGETGQRMLLGYRPGTYGNIDTDMYGEDDPCNQWRLVSRADRNALLATATAEHPQDASFLIQSPNFSQREDVSAWVSQYSNGSIWGRYDNHPDFAYECWNEASFDLSQTLYDLLPGYYAIGVQGFYRDGDHENQIRQVAAGAEPVQAASLMTANLEEVLLPNILSGLDRAPGLGDRRSVLPLIEKVDEDGNVVYNEETGEPEMVEDQSAERQYLGEFPYNIPQACDYFQNGLYKTQLLVEVQSDGMLDIIISKNRADVPRDWVVVDNFRLVYYGSTKPSEEQLGVKDATTAIAPARGLTYNMQGQQVNAARARGLFIRDGRKFFVK